VSVPHDVLFFDLRLLFLITACGVTERYTHTYTHTHICAHMPVCVLLWCRYMCCYGASMCVDM